VGDAHDRFLIRLREISQSLEILKQATDSMPLGEYMNGKGIPDFTVPAGEAHAQIESCRGMLSCHAVSDGKHRPSRVQFRAPTTPLLEAIPELVCGVRVEDLPVVLASLDLGIAEADR
jgi:NADH-quinone oxidoreductase subunit D